jgi:hypothetical protein
MEAMIIRFETFLSDQIFTMMMDRVRQRRINSEEDASSYGSDEGGCQHG